MDKVQQAGSLLSVALILLRKSATGCQPVLLSATGCQPVLLSATGWQPVVQMLT